MSAPLIIIARIDAVPGKAELLEAHMRTLVEDTRREPGCIRYELNRGREDTNLFVFTEEWSSHAMWRAHMEGDSIRAFNQRIGKEMIAGAEVMQLERVLTRT